MSIFKHLESRGYIYQATNLPELENSLDSSSKLTCYCGFDPTAKSLHIGNLLQLILLRKMQMAGHTPIALVGGSTGLIGDPKQAGERKMNAVDIVEQYVEYIKKQFSFILELDGSNAVKIVNNLDWMSKVDCLSFLRDIGKHFRVSQMLAKEVVSARLKSPNGISYSEFSYQILQAYDYYELNKQYGCSLQTGGSDQWGNIVSGVDYIRRVTGKTVNAFCTPLVTKQDGTKFGKTEDGTVWLDKDLFSPYKFYQFWINSEDSKVIEYIKLFTFLSDIEIDSLNSELIEFPEKRSPQKKLAMEVTALVHGKDVALAVKNVSETVFAGKQDFSNIAEKSFSILRQEIPFVKIKDVSKLSAVDLFVLSSLAKTNNEARRFIKEGGAYINNIKVQDANITYESKLLFGKYLLLRKGKKNYALVGIEK